MIAPQHTAHTAHETDHVVHSREQSCLTRGCTPGEHVVESLRGDCSGVLGSQRLGGSSSSVDLLSRSKSGYERAHGVVVSAAKEMKGALVGPKTQETGMAAEEKARRWGPAGRARNHTRSEKGHGRRPAPRSFPAPSVG